MSASVWNLPLPVGAIPTPSASNFHNSITREARPRVITPPNAYGTAVSLVATKDNVNQATTASSAAGVSLYNGTISVMKLSGSTSGAAGFQQINQVSGVVLLSYNATTNTVTGYYNGIPIGSFSLSSWGSSPSVGLGVLGFSGEGASVSTNFDTAYNFYASNTPPPRRWLL